MRKCLVVALACCISFYAADGFAVAPDPCRNATKLERIASSNLSKSEKILSSLDRRFEGTQRNIENKRLGLENRKTGIESAVAFQESKMATCDVTAGILTQIFNDSTVTRATCTSTGIVSSILGTGIDVAKCAIECGLLSDPKCQSSCERRIQNDQRRCQKLAQGACIRAVGYRVKVDALDKQLESATFNSTCTNSTTQACPNGLLRNLKVKIDKATVERDGAKKKSDDAEAALAACLAKTTP